VIAAAASEPRSRPLATASLRALAVLAVSLLGAALLALLQQYALLVFGGVALLALVIWRPRYGLYLVVLSALAFEPTQSDLLMLPGYAAQSDIKSLAHLSFLPFTPIEALTVLTLLVMFGHMAAQRRLPRSGQLSGGIWLFLLLIGLSTTYGISRGGDATVALWEVRCLVVGGAIALLIPELLHERRHVDTLIALITGGAVFLAGDVLLRHYTTLRHASVEDLVLAYAHDTPIVFNVAIVLLLARLIWPASRGQRWAALLLIPLLLFAELVTERRAGLVALDVALMIVALLIMRLRGRLFVVVVLPLALIYCGYLGVFWNSTSSLGQPARAVRSISSPDQRDASSNDYRVLEAVDIRLNIRAAPLTGLGFGKPFTFYIPLPDLSFWVFWHYMTHNSFLWVWMTMGPIGFIVFLTVLGATLLRGVQLTRLASHSRAAPTVIALSCAIVMILVFAYVDVALTSVRICALLGVAMGVIGAWGKNPALIGEASQP
jgi:hypothetical protein